MTRRRAPSEGADQPVQAPAARHRFFVAEPPEGGVAVLRSELARRLAGVLRLGSGERVQLFDGSGRSWVATLATVQRDRVELATGETEQHPPVPRTLLLAGLIRPSRFDWLIEKATELGVSVIQPLLTARSAVRPGEVGRARLERWRRIAVEAAEQCGRFTVPAIAQPLTLADALASAEGRLIAATEPAHGAPPALGRLLDGVGASPVTLLIGPEGGLAPEEVDAALRSGAEAASLGPLILRTETAALAALAILQDARQPAGLA